MQISRRTFLRAGFGIATATAGASLLTACGSHPDAAPNAAGGQGDAGVDTRTVTDRTDAEIEVPADPQRVITLSEPTLDGALALGVTPIGTTAGRGLQTVPNYLLDRAADVPIVGNIGQPNFEAIGAARPDLILVDGTGINNNEDIMNALRRIAPVVVTGYAGTDWRTNLEITAAALGKEEEARRVVEEYNATVEAVKAQLGDYQDKTFSIIRWQGNSASLILKELPAGLTLTDLGLRRPPAQDRNGRAHSEPVSLENLRDIDADYMFFGTLGGSSVGNPNAGGSADVDSAAATLADAAQVPGFAALGAYQAQHVLPVDGSAWTSTGGPLLVRSIVEDTRRWLIDRNGTFDPR